MHLKPDGRITRFGLSNSEGATSPLWRMWVQGDETYLANAHWRDFAVLFSRPSASPDDLIRLLPPRSAVIGPLPHRSGGAAWLATFVTPMTGEEVEHIRAERDKFRMPVRRSPRSAMAMLMQNAQRLSARTGSSPSKIQGPHIIGATAGELRRYSTMPRAGGRSYAVAQPQVRAHHMLPQQRGLNARTCARPLVLGR